MSEFKIKHPTHVCASVNKEGLHRSGPMYLELNDKGNWVQFRRNPGEWDVKTGVSTYDTNWNYRLVNIREVTREDLVEYWSKDKADAIGNKHLNEAAVEDARKQLRLQEESLECCIEWIAWSDAHLQDVTK